MTAGEGRAIGSCAAVMVADGERSVLVSLDSLPARLRAGEPLFLWAANAPRRALDDVPPRPSPPCRAPAALSLLPKPPRLGVVVSAHPIPLFASFADARCFADAPRFSTDRTLDRGRAERARVDRLWPVRRSSAHHLLVPRTPAHGPPAGDPGARCGTASSVGGPPEPTLASAGRAPRAPACTHPRTLCPKRSSSM